MEEILASIRRIMADDEQPAQHAEPPHRRSEPAHPGETRTRRPPEPRVVAQRQAPLEPPPAPRRPVPPHDAASAAPAGYAAQQRPTPSPAPTGRGNGERLASAAAERAQRVWLDEQDEAVFAEATNALRQVQREHQVRHEHHAEAVRPEPRPARPMPQQPYPHHAAEATDERHTAPMAAPAAQPRATRPQPAAAAFEDRAGQPANEPAGEAVRRRDLLSANADAAVMAAFRNLGDVLLPQKERTVEDLVKEILRPMLKDWLDANLPTIVEDLVRAEIERVARRQR